MRRFLLIAALLLCPLAKAQTTTYTYQATGCSGSCSLYYYAAASGAATAPVIVYVPGGAYENPPDSLCINTNPSLIGLNTCPEVTDWTNHGYDVYAVRYPVYGDTGNPQWPTMGQGVACALSYSVTNSLAGNWNNVTMVIDSAGSSGAVVAMAPVGKYLTDGNSTCASSNTSWTITSLYMNSGTACMSNATNCYCNSPGVVRCINIFGGDPTSSGPAELLAVDASLTNWVTSWVAKGAFPITMVTTTADGTVPSSNQALLPAATAAAGHPITQALFTNYNHLMDMGLLKTACPSSVCTWPISLQTAAYYTTPNCLNSATTCNLAGEVDRVFNAAMYPRGASAAGGSGAAGGS